MFICQSLYTPGRLSVENRPKQLELGPFLSPYRQHTTCVRIISSCRCHCYGAINSIISYYIKWNSDFETHRHCSSKKSNSQSSIQYYSINRRRIISFAKSRQSTMFIQYNLFAILCYAYSGCRSERPAFALYGPEKS